ncbi:MAG: peptidoglycan editing factor PgeF [Candidatus Shapirobacteria bacterium]|nr:peptidoglycan editing factor PgeF [Candidatus Shapirobacteria bacterium]
MIAKLSLFKQEKKLIHGSSDKSFGDFRLNNNSNLKNQRIFLQQLAVSQFPLVWARQVHGNQVALINQTNNKQPINGADGLISREKNLVLGVRSADCLPIIYFEPKKEIIGIAHAGWRGVLSGLPKEMISIITSLGGESQNIIIGIGPHIKACCYCVDQDIANQFKKKYSHARLINRSEKFLLNLAAICQKQFEETGIRKNHIQISNICTFCQSDQWWSRRRDGENCGNMLTVVCQTNDPN